MSNLDVYNKFREVPKDAQKEITGGRLKGFTDINPMWRIKMLTEHFGICGFGWKTEIVSQKLKSGANNEISAFMTIHLFVKVGDKWSEPIVGLGGSSFVTNERNGLYTSDEAFKMAYTDALSIACKSLGMGADVYYQKDRTKYDQAPSDKEVKPMVDIKERLKTLETDLKKCKTRADVATIWNANKDLHSNKEFEDFVKQVGEKLKENAK